MKLTIDTETGVVLQEKQGYKKTLPLYSPEAFELLSLEWLRVGWDQHYFCTFSWCGFPILQLPEDLIRIQEVIYQLRPDVIFETGICHGGSLIYYASLCKVLGKGRVIGVDIQLPDEVQKAVQTHPLGAYVTMLQGSSTAPEIVNRIKSMIQPGETVLVILDSNHSKQHVQQELEAYHDLVTPGSYIVATDGIMKDLHDVPQGIENWSWNNPTAAAAEFAERHPEFCLEQPPWPYNRSRLKHNVTYWPGAWLRRKDKG